MSNKKTILFVIALIVLVIGLSTINATKVANDTNDNQITTQSTKDVKVSSDNTNKVQTDKKAITKKDKKEVKTDGNSIHNINNTNFEEYFSNLGYLKSEVQAGDTLNIIGEITKNSSMIIDRPLNITGSENAHINLNTTSKGDTGGEPGNSFTLQNGAAYSNVSNIFFENTQIFVKNTTGVVINNITTYVHDRTVGAGVGTVAIRENCDNITIENSHFTSKDNGGRSTVVFTKVKNSLFRNNTITGIGNVGNLFYLNAYNLPGAESSNTSLNTNNTIRDNFINGTDAIKQDICFAVAICGEDNNFINNTIYHSGTGISSAMVTGGDSLSVRTKIVNNTVLYNSIQTPKNGTVQGNKIGILVYSSSDSIITDNEVMNVSVETKNVTIDGMDILGTLSLSGSVDGLVISNSHINDMLLSGSSGSYKSSIKIFDNNINTLQIGKDSDGYVRNLNLTNNRIYNQVNMTGLNLRNINILNNTIINEDEEYAIKVDSNNAYIRNTTIDGNFLIAERKYGNDAISAEDYEEIIGTNYPYINIKGNLTLGEPSLITFEVGSNSELPESLSVAINDDQTVIELTDGKGNISYTPLTDNDVKVEAIYADNDYRIINTTSLKVKPEITNLTVTPSVKQVTLGDKLNITVKLTTTGGNNISSEKVTITVDGQIFNGTTNENGEYTFEFTTKTLGLNNIFAKFNKTPDYKESNATNNFTVIKQAEPVATTLTVTPSKTTVTLGDKLNIKTKLVNSSSAPVANQNVSITVGGQTFNGITNNNGEYTFEFTSKTLGLNNIVARFTGNDTYKASNATNNFTVVKPVATTLIVTPSKTTVTLDDKLNITTKLVTAPSTPFANQKVSITVDGQQFNGTTNNNGEYTFEFTTKTIGINNIVARFTGNDTYKASNATNNFTVTKPLPATTKLTAQITGTKVGKTKLSATLTDQSGKAIPNAKLIIMVDQNNTNNLTTNNQGKTTADLNLNASNHIIQVIYPGNDDFKTNITTLPVNITKNDVNITLTPVKGIIGEKITLTAYLKDLDGSNITGGNLAFKLNGKTLRSDGRFDSNAPAMKFKVENGKVTYTINADLYLRNAKNLTASYSGNYKYKEMNSQSVEAQIQKRYAQVTTTLSPKIVKQYQTLQLTATVKDVTKKGKNTTLINQDTRVMFKVNGVTLKDKNGKTLYVNVGKDNKAVYNYTIPAGTGGITASKKARDYKVDAIFVGDNYYPGARNATTFNVERSATYVGITQVKASKTNVLSISATLKDYKGNYLIGTNKVTIKINGKNYVNPTTGKAVYWSVKDGKVSLSGIQIDPKTTIKRVMVVTGERQAYHEGRNETTNIVRV